MGSDASLLFTNSEPLHSSLPSSIFQQLSAEIHAAMYLQHRPGAKTTWRGPPSTFHHHEIWSHPMLELELTWVNKMIHYVPALCLHNRRSECQRPKTRRVCINNTFVQAPVSDIPLSQFQDVTDAATLQSPLLFLAGPFMPALPALHAVTLHIPMIRGTNAWVTQQKFACLFFVKLHKCTVTSCLSTCPRQNLHMLWQFCCWYTRKTVFPFGRLHPQGYIACHVSNLFRLGHRNGLVLVLVFHNGACHFQWPVVSWRH